MSMLWSDDLSVSDALAKLRCSNVLLASPADAEKWSFNTGPVVITLPNFSWRRRAIDRHDLHHVLINQPCNLKGECQVATWEFAAGAYPSIWPQLFCLPLVAAGFIISPTRTWQTFKSGRRQRSLYGLAIESGMRLGDLRDYIGSRSQGGSSAVSNWLRFFLLVSGSFAPVLTPVVVAATF